MKAFTRSLLILLVFSTAIGAQGPSGAEIPRLKRQADSAFVEKKFDRSRTLFRQLTVTDRWNGAHWLRLGDSEAALRNYPGAIAAIRVALDMGFGSRPARSLQIARFFSASGQADSSLAWVRRALDAGYEARASIAQDSAFASLFGNPEFRRLTTGFVTKPATRNAGWISDVDYLVREAKRFATGPGHFALSPRFDSAANRLKQRIPSLDDQQVFVEMQRLMAALGSGHSILYPVSTPAVSLSMVPVDLYQFTDGLFVTGGAGMAAQYVGYKVEKIGGVPIETVLARAESLVPVDNRMGYAWNAAYFLNFPAMLRSLGAGTTGDSITYSLRNPSGAPVETTLAAGELRMPSKLGRPAAGEPPLYLRNPDREYWIQPLPERSALYVQYNQVRDAEGFSIEQLADSISRVARDTDTKNVIIDVRRNNGGSGHLNRPLIRALIQFEGLNPANRVIVITGRNTFSAAQNFINDAERWTNAIFAGEPSSSRPNFVGEDTELILPWSGVTGSIASRYFQDSDPTDVRQWIPMDIPVSLSSAAYFANRDPVLEAVLRFLASP